MKIYAFLCLIRVIHEFFLLVSRKHSGKRNEEKGERVMEKLVSIVD